MKIQSPNIPKCCCCDLTEIFLEKVKILLALLFWLRYNTFCRYGIGLSPNGKALDSDSSILGVRVPQAQLEPPQMMWRFCCIIGNIIYMEVLIENFMLYDTKCAEVLGR